MICNGIDIGVTYNANILDFAEGGYSISNNYVQPPGGLQFVKLTPPGLPLKKLKITLDIAGSSYFDLETKVSSLTALFYSSRLSLSDFGDGMTWDCILTATSEIKEVAPWIYQISFTFAGYKKGEIITVTPSVFPATITVSGNYETDPVITLTDCSAEIKIFGITISNITGTVIIDSVNKRITDNGSNKLLDCDLTSFPKLQPGQNTISLTGTATVAIAYSPIYM